jgi:hypothetical protein
LYDVVTTSIYDLSGGRTHITKYDRTLALRLAKTRSYPSCKTKGQAGWDMVLSTATGYYENVMTTLTVKIPEALERSIAIAARRERVTKSELVRRAMAKYIAQTGEDRTFQSAIDLAGDLIGSVRGGPVDLATNAKYMDDYGK